MAKHWNEISQLYTGLFPDIPAKGDQPPSLTEQSYESASYLVYEFLARQIGKERYSVAEHNQEESIYRLLYLHLGLRTDERIQREKLHVEDHAAYASVEREELQRLRVPFIIGTRIVAHEGTAAIPTPDLLWWRAFGVKTIGPALTCAAAASSFCVLLVFPIEFQGLGFSFHGASKPAVMWIFAFLAFGGIVRLLW